MSTTTTTTLFRRPIAVPSCLPATCSIDLNHRLTLIAEATLGDALRTPHTAAYDFNWLKNAHAAALIVDLGAMLTLNSSTISWLLRLSHAAGAINMTIRGNRRVVTQLRMLHLDQVFNLALIAMNFPLTEKTEVARAH
jgi:hypothetical protein